jgi:hypothetical protein
MWISNSLTPFIEESFLSPVYILAAFVENYLAINMWIYFEFLYSVSLVYMSVLMVVLSLNFSS